MSGHTPGPWALSTIETCIGTCHRIGPFPSNGVHDESHACVYADNIRMCDYGRSKVGDELLANARLMAAAPDLLAMLTEARVTLEMWKDVAPAISLCADIDMLIARAKGES